MVHELAACRLIGQVCVLVYVDDILIYSKMTDDHLAHAKAVFECFAAKNWHIKEKKCAFSYVKWNFWVI